MAATASYDQNGVTQNSRRVSRAYEQPVVQHAPSGGGRGMVVYPESEKSAQDPSQSASLDSLGRRFDALGGLLAKVALGCLTLAGALVSLAGKASLEAASQLFGFMLLFVLTFAACTGAFYWWGGSSKRKVTLTVNKVIHIYLLCISAEILARIIAFFTAVPASSGVPTDIGYFLSLATLLLFVFSVFVHKDGLNAMFSQESVLFVACTLALNFSSTCLFSDVLPRLVLPQMVYAALLLGLSMYLTGYKFPRVSPSGIYWLLSESRPPARPVVTVETSGPSSRTNSLQQSHRESFSSSVSKYRTSVSSVSSQNSFFPVSLERRGGGGGGGGGEGGGRGRGRGGGRGREEGERREGHVEEVAV